MEKILVIFSYETQDGYNFRSIDGLIVEGNESFDNEQYDKMHTFEITLIFKFRCKT